MSLQRVGFYLWGGPGTIRINEVKYFDPKHDVNSLLGCYDYDYLAHAQELFGITDVWVTYSWGFNEQTEAEDYRFLLDRLDNFKRLNLRVHAYIQGPNLVYADFPDVDWWARDHKNRTITYYRGRWVTSIHHQGYVDYVLEKIRKTHGLGFDGIFMDNIQHGQLGFPTRPDELPFVFCGDASAPAQAQFKAETGQAIPYDFEKDPELTKAYLDFRVRSNTSYIAQVAEAVHEGGMEFGTNFYDPKFDPTHIYGIDIHELEKHQDYLLFENHALPTDDGTKHNGYIEELIDKHAIKKPVFVVTYREGVGMSPQFTQSQVDNILSEAKRANFYPCIKGGEFTTKGIWHNLYLDDFKMPNTEKDLPRQPMPLDSELVNTLLAFKPFRAFIKRYYNPLFTIAFEWRMARFIVNIVYTTTLL